MLRFAGPAAALAAIVCGSTFAGQAAARSASRCTARPSAETADYWFALGVLPPQRISTEAEIRRQKIHAGERIIYGRAVTEAGPAWAQRHIEIYICARHGGRVILGANPRIVLADLSAAASRAKESLPLAAMYAIQRGPGDIHYGNNAHVVPGHRYRVTVELSGQQAALYFRAPRRGQR